MKLIINPFSYDLYSERRERLDTNFKISDTRKLKNNKHEEKKCKK